ncbi:MAG: hypothetical protein EA371_04725 [Gammaproteobacteria bacterium]|nr:MAG: hypothetical protein EA371_04725 [Gammaproteobacteria bacterium]
MQHRTIRGRLAYVGPTGAERGREFFTMTMHGDGRRILRAHSEIEENEILRDVTYTVDAQWRPVEAFVRLSAADRFLGSGWFQFDEHGGRCESFSRDDGRLSQHLPTATPPRCFGAHPISGDAWMLTPFDMSRRDEPQVISPALMSSLAFNGASGPRLHALTYSLAFRGEQRIEVPAGRFDAWKFEFLLDDSEVAGHPPYHVWVTADGDYVVLRAEVGAPRDYTYLLTEFARA